jgi:hypothetical protein
MKDLEFTRELELQIAFLISASALIAFGYWLL